MINVRKICSLTYVAVTALILFVMSVLSINNVFAAATTVVTIVDSEGGSTEVTEDGSGAGWLWDASTSTLTLDGFNGQRIESNGDINIHLIGENTITMVDTEKQTEEVISAHSGSSNFDITITSENNGKLNIVGDIHDSFRAIYGDIVFVNGKLSISASTDLTNAKSVASTGIYGMVEFTENEIDAAQIDVDIEIKGNKFGYLYGIGNTTPNGSDFIIKNRDNVTVNVKLTTSSFSILTGIVDLNVINAAPKIKIITNNNDSSSEHYTAIDNIEALDLKSGGMLEFEGIVGSLNVLYKTNVNTVTTIPSNNEYIWDKRKTQGYEAYILCDLNGNTLKKGKFVYSETPIELKYNGENMELPACNVYDDVKFNTRYLIIGARDYNVFGDEGAETANWKFEIIEGELPSGVSLNTNSGVISGSPDRACSAGSVKIRATETAYTLDTSDDRSVEFVVKYGAVTAKSVTDVLIVEKKVVLNQGQTYVIRAIVTPSDATIPDLNFTIEGVAQIVKTEAKSDGTTECTVKAGNTPGVACLRATSVDSDFDDIGYIFVKENRPQASQNEDYITNLEAGKKYLINDVEEVADENGHILIDDAWRGEDVLIQKKHSEKLCNSDPQLLYIDKKIIKQNMVSIQYLNVTYDGLEKTPTVSIVDDEKCLILNTDYLLKYENNVNAGKAKVIVEGIGIYKDTVEMEFDILPMNIFGKKVTISETNYVYDGTAKEPQVTVEGLVSGRDYTVTYKNNKNVGTAKVLITGKGNYTGTIEKSFEITKPEDKPQQPEQSDKPQQPEQSDKPQQPDNPGKTEEKDMPAVDVSYRTHIQTYGWEGIGNDIKTWKSNGIMSGTSGESKRLEGINIVVNSADSSKKIDLGIQYTTHCQSYGWLPWSSNGDMNGTEAEAKRLEAIKIQLTGADKDYYDVYYRVHAQSHGWLGWAKNGEPAGTAGEAKRLEGIQIIVVKKGEKYDVNMGKNISAIDKAYIAHEGMSPVVNYPATSNAVPVIPGEDTPNVAYRTHVQSFGWQGWKYNGQMSGTSGLAKRLEGININLTNKPCEGGIVYITHVQSYGWQGDLTKPETWKGNGDMSGTSGEGKRLEAICIKLTGEMAEKYDVYYRVHAQTYGWLNWSCNGEPAGTSGQAKRLEGIQVVIVPKGQKPSDTYNGVTITNPKSYIY